MLLAFCLHITKNWELLCWGSFVASMHIRTQAYGSHRQTCTEAMMSANDAARARVSFGHWAIQTKV
eukprot:3229433-Amphidinium_carterae.1